MRSHELTRNGRTDRILCPRIPAGRKQIRSRHLLFLFLLFLLPVMPAWGQTTPLTLTEAISRARHNHPLLVAAKQRVLMFEGELLEAGHRPNPTLTLSTENVPLSPPEGGFAFNRTMDWFAYFSQTIERGNKRELRSATAERAVELARIEAEVVERQIVYEVKIAYQHAAIARERMDLMSESSNHMKQLLRLNEVRVNAGYTAEGDLIKTRVETQRIEYFQVKAGIEYDKAQITLMKTMGERAFDNDLVLADRLEYQPVSLDAQALSQAALKRSSILVIEARVERARTLLRLEEARAKPDLTASFGYKRNGINNSLYGAISIPIPVYNKNRGNIDRARAEVEMHEAELQFERSAALAELTAARRAVEANERQVERLRSEFLRNADESQQISLAAYREGAVDLLHLIDAQRTRTQAQELYLQAVSDYRMATHELERAAGIERLPTRDLVRDTNK